MIGTGLIEEQVFNSFVNVDPGSSKVELEEPTQAEQPIELSVCVLDIWSSDDENEALVDLWEDKEKEESQLVGKVEEKKEEVESVEAKAEEAQSSNREAKKKETIASV